MELRQRVASALRSVGGVIGVAEHDNESWLVTGTLSGEALTSAAASVVDGVPSAAAARVQVAASPQVSSAFIFHSPKHPPSAYCWPLYAGFALPWMVSLRNC